VRSPTDSTIDRFLLLYLLKVAAPFGIDGDVKFQQLVFLSELQLFGKQAKGFHYRFFRYAYGGYSKELQDDFLALGAKKFVDGAAWKLAEAGEKVVKVFPAAVSGHSHNETVATIIRDVVRAYGKYDSSTIVPAVEKIELILPEKPDADAEGVSQQETLPIGHVSFHATLLVPERIETPVEFKLKDDLLAALQDILK
jgi:uncharacterized protein YwgA